MNGKDIFITVANLEGREKVFKIGQNFILEKDFENEDPEVINIYSWNHDDEEGIEKTLIGYVANSGPSMAKGTYSAGRIYDKIGDIGKCSICFIHRDVVIAKVLQEEKISEIGKVSEDSKEEIFSTTINW